MEKIASTKQKRKFKFPLWAKTLVVLLMSVSLVSVVAIVFSANTLRNTSRNYYIDHSIKLADTLGIYLNLDDVKTVRNAVETKFESIPDDQKVENSDWGSPEWEAYLTNYDDVVAMPAYTRLLNQLSTFHAKNDAKYTYVAYADYVGKRLVYLVDDSPIDERCLPGSFDFFTEQDMTVFDHLDEGFYPEITNMPEYGYLVSTGRPIMDGTTQVALALVDLSMDAIVAEENNNIRTMSLILAGLGTFAIVVGYTLVLTLVVRPMRKLTKAANDFTKEDHNDSLRKFSEVKINTKDEIEDLSNSMKKMEEDINNYIADLLSTTTKLAGAEKQAVEMKTLANIDALTGANNKRAYFEVEERLNKEIRKGKANFIIWMVDLNNLKQTNDTFGHEKGDELIVAVSNAIKESFPGLPIYRIGGDEFVVISENGKDAEKFEKAFVSKLKHTKDVSAAIGHATFDSSMDNNVEDTFKRAEELMYENKKYIKSNQ